MSGLCFTLADWDATHAKWAHYHVSRACPSHEWDMIQAYWRDDQHRIPSDGTEKE